MINSAVTGPAGLSYVVPASPASKQQLYQENHWNASEYQLSYKWAYSV